MKYNKEFPSEDCPNCGSELIVKTDCSPSDDNDFENFFNEDDEVTCSLLCGFKSIISVSDGEARVQDGNRNQL